MKVKANGIQIAYDDHGAKDAPVIIICHSLATDRRMWDTFVHELKDTYRIITPDARGHGESDAPEGAYDLKILMHDVLGLMDALSIDKAHYVGLSMGGMIGQYLGIYAPERIKTLTLCATTSFIPPSGTQNMNQRIADAEEDGMEGQLGPVIDNWFPDDFQESDPEVIADVEKLIAATPVKGFCGWLHAIKEINITSELHRIKAPVLITAGDQDPGTPVAAAEVIYDEIADVNMVIFPDSSHQHPLQYPHDHADMIRDHVDDYEHPEKDIWDDEV